MAGGAEDFTDVLGEVPAVGEPGAVLAESKGEGGGDVGCGSGAVAGAFRTIVIHHPIRRGQASFIDGNHFFCERGGELRDELLLHAYQQAASGESDENMVLIPSYRKKLAQFCLHDA